MMMNSLPYICREIGFDWTVLDKLGSKFNNIAISTNSTL
jgi:hypothetical protein